MNERDETLEVLRDAWRSEELGDETPSASLDACDGPTRDAVAWLRSAWAQQRDEDVPSIPIALARVHERRRRRRVMRRLAGVALTAVAAALAFAALRQSDGEAHPSDIPVATGRPQRPSVPAPSATTYVNDSFRSRRDGVEIVRGSVRLVLLTDQPSPTPPPSRTED
ncbi:MAG: hypothetical protein AAF726_25495 [Planctomycetota bacterium]